eukprot:COSAG02_NODE_2693_length_8220_cov_3.340106_2_plen_237_part_00
MADHEVEEVEKAKQDSSSDEEAPTSEQLELALDALGAEQVPGQTETQHTSESTVSRADLQDALLQEAARRITWSVGQVINVDTEDGLEEGATILGPSSDGDATEMQVRFADGSVENWDIEDFVATEADASGSDTVATGKAAAIALQHEILKHGTDDIEKIKRLRRASMQPDDAGAAMAAAAAATAASSAADDDIAEVKETEEMDANWNVGQVVDSAWTPILGICCRPAAAAAATVL